MREGTDYKLRVAVDMSEVSEAIEEMRELLSLVERFNSSRISVAGLTDQSSSV